MAPARRTADATEALRASLIEHALRIVHRDGADALTMRALATEAGCAVGLPYKVFGGRDELVATLVEAELRGLAAALEDLVAAAGTATVAENLDRFADVLLGGHGEALKLADVHGDPDPHGHLRESVRRSGFLAQLASAMPRYLAAEKAGGRVAADVDVDAVGFLVTGAVHNLLVSGDAYPRPDRAGLRRHLAALADLLGAGPGPAAHV